MRLGITGINALDGHATVTSSGGGAGPVTVPGPNIGPYTVDRTTLRCLLMLDFQDDEISFGKVFTHYTISDNAGDSNFPGVTAHFSDGSTFAGGLLVGADGLRSRVRRQYLPHHVPVDTDGRCVYGKAPITPELVSRFPAPAMRHMTLISEPTPLGLFLEPMRFPPTAASSRLPAVADYVYWVLSARSAVFGLSDAELLALAPADAAALSLTAKWDAGVRALLELQSTAQTSALRRSSFKPILPEWDASPCVTLLGDAVHAMSPSGGVGANTALRDAKNLCEAIVSAAGQLTAEGVGKYESEMRVYARVAIEESYHRNKRMYRQPPFEECKPLEL